MKNRTHLACGPRSGHQHYFTVRCLNSDGDYLAHQEHIVGLPGVASYKAAVARAAKRRVRYVRIFNETLGTTRYVGCTEQTWPRGHEKITITEKKRGER